MFEQIADGAPVSMWRSDKTMACDWVNKAWLEFTGRPLDQELGFGWTDILHPEDREACIQSYGQAFAKGQPFSLMYRMRRADGEFRWVLDQVRPFKNDSGQIEGFFGACTDVDEMVKANEALSGAVIERANAVAQRDHLLSEVQHRVRNNLQLVLSIIDMQARSDPASRPALALIARRVRSIAKAQALLLDPVGAAQIDLGDYLPSLAQGLRRAPAIEFRGPGKPVFMALGRAVPLGLIINELLTSATNAYSDAPLQILLTHENGAAEIVIETLGGQADPSASEAQPSQLVQRLTTQAGVKIDVTPDTARKFVLHIDGLE
ncbi:MAG: PAS domain-containing protein [Beijerinckiaceae bacterium]|nr:PAS domain-containing protein [Beijerinckiaceae bacterium]